MPHSDALPNPVSLSRTEYAALQEATVLAARGAGTVVPNPVVGCVLLSPTGQVVGTGFHQQAGGPHAEVFALREAGDAARGATAVVTLEPCHHTGRTGPCSAALIAAGVARVIVAVPDPSPEARGGIAALRAAGIDVVDLSDALFMTSPSGSDDAVDSEMIAGAVAAAEDVNRVWLAGIRHKKPFVTLKMATTIDGRVAAADGSSRWISSPESRADAHLLRAQVDTMLVGVGTVLADNPLLTARDSDGKLSGRQPLRVVLDSRGRTPADAAVRNDDAPTLVATAAEFGADEAGRVSLPALLQELYARGQRHVLIEGGPVVAAAALDAGVVDEVLLYLAPKLLGAGLPALAGGTVGTIAEAHSAELREVRQCGPDIRARYALSPSR